MLYQIGLILIFVVVFSLCSNTSGQYRNPPDYYGDYHRGYANTGGFWSGFVGRRWLVVVLLVLFGFLLLF